MAGAEWWWWPLPAWLGSGAAWFVVLNIVVGAIAVLSSRARPSSSSPRLGGISRRASSAVLQRLRSFSTFSFPSACFYTAPDTAATTFQETEEPGTARKKPSRPSALAPPAAAEPAPEAEEEEEDDDEPEEDANSMSMEEAYALVLAGRQRPAPTEEEVSRSEVDAKAEEFIRGFKDDLRQQRLNSIFNYTQMLKKRALATGRRQIQL